MGPGIRSALKMYLAKADGLLGHAKGIGEGLGHAAAHTGHAAGDVMRSAAGAAKANPKLAGGAIMGGGLYGAHKAIDASNEQDEETKRLLEALSASGQ